MVLFTTTAGAEHQTSEVSKNRCCQSDSNTKLLLLNFEYVISVYFIPDIAHYN